MTGTQIDHGARAAILDLLVDYGYDVLDDPQGFENMLRDRFGSAYSRERRSIVCALREGFPEQLRRAGDAMLRSMTISRLIAHLENQCAMDSSAARWSVETLALAIYGDTPAHEGSSDERTLPERTPDDPRQRLTALAVATLGWPLVVVPAGLLASREDFGIDLRTRAVASTLQCFVSGAARRWIVRKYELERWPGFAVGVTAWFYVPNLGLAALALVAALGDSSRARSMLVALVIAAPACGAAVVLRRSLLSGART